MATIDPQRLKVLRKQKYKGKSRKDFATKALVSARQLARLEGDSASPIDVRELTLDRLAKALGVEPEVLTGEQPMPDSIQASVQLAAAPDPKRTQVSALLSSEARLAYALVRRRYGVTPAALFNAAPTLFALLAEGSFHWRRERVAAIKEAASRLQEFGGSGHMAFANAASRSLEGCLDEERSIESDDLFGRKVGQDAFDLGYDDETNNPFADYLRHLSETIGRPERISMDSSMLEYGALDGFPSSEVCAGDLERITAGSHKAGYSLKMGHAQLSDIPDELWADGADERRAQWLEDRIPEKDRKFLDLTIDDLLRPRSVDGKEDGQ